MIRSQSEKGCLDDGSVRGLRSTLQLGSEDSAIFRVALVAEILGQAFATIMLRFHCLETPPNLLFHPFLGCYSATVHVPQVLTFVIYSKTLQILQDV